MVLRRWRGLCLPRPAVKIWRFALFNRLRHNTDQFSSISLSKLFTWGRRRFTRIPSDSVTVPLLEEHGKPEQYSPPRKGHLVVYVADYKDGRHSGAAVPRRYVVPVVYMNHPLFGELLTEAVEEFGYDHSGGITIPCPVARFERVRNRIAASVKTRFGLHGTAVFCLH